MEEPGGGFERAEDEDGDGDGEGAEGFPGWVWVERGAGEEGEGEHGEGGQDGVVDRGGMGSGWRGGFVAPCGAGDAEEAQALVGDVGCEEVDEG